MAGRWRSGLVREATQAQQRHQAPVGEQGPDRAKGAGPVQGGSRQVRSVQPGNGGGSRRRDNMAAHRS